SMVEGASNAASRAFRFFARKGGERFSGGETRRAAKQQITSGAIRPFGIEAGGRHPRADTVERFSVLFHFKRPLPEIEGERMVVGRLARFLDVDSATDQIDSDNSAEAPTVAVCVALEACFRFLFVKSVAVDRNPVLDL